MHMIGHRGAVSLSFHLQVRMGEGGSDSGEEKDISLGLLEYVLSLSLPILIRNAPDRDVN